MGLLGKLLIVFNLLAGGGFVYLASQDWVKRQTLTAADLRHRLTLQGLPLENPEPAADAGDPNDPDAEVPFAAEGPGGVTVGSVSKKFLESYFKAVTDNAPPAAASPGAAAPAPAPAAEGAAGAAAGVNKLGSTEPVASQVAEVKRARAALQNILASAEEMQASLARQADSPEAKAELAQVRAVTDPAKLAPYFLSKILLRQAQTLEERAEVFKLRAAGDGARLTELLLAKFDRVIDPAKTTDEGERRFRLADLLITLDTDALWQKRVALVVGLRNYAPRVSAQSARFVELAAQVERRVEQDQVAFVETYYELQKLAIDRTLRVNDSERAKAGLLKQVARDAEVKAQWETQVAKYKGQLADARALVNAALARQAKVEAKLFEVQRTVGTTLDDLFRLEDELARRERGGR